MKKWLVGTGLVLTVIYAAGWSYCREVFPSKYRKLIRETAREFKLDPLLVGAIVFSESRYRENAVSPAGAIGLMQVMPLTGVEVSYELKLENFTAEDLMKRDVNVRIGCFYFSKLKRRLEGQDWLALAAYNAGEGNIRNWLDGADAGRSRVSTLKFRETRRYVRKIEMLYLGLRMCRKMRLV